MGGQEAADLGQQIATLTERIEGMRVAVNLADQANEQRLKDSEARIREDIDRMDKRINGRITRVEARLNDHDREIFSEKVVLARVQGAAEERERHGLPPDPLPPPVPNGPVPLDQVPATVPRWVTVLVGVCAAVAGVLGAGAAFIPLVEKAFT